MSRPVERADVEGYLRGRAGGRIRVHAGNAHVACPACNGSGATVSLEHGKVGVWYCHGCKATGPWSAFLEAAGDAPAAPPDRASQRVAQIGSGLRATTAGTGWRVARAAPSQPTNGAAESTEPAKAKGGAFAWREDLAAECAARLWTDEAASALAYLRDGRKLSEPTIRAFGLGTLTAGGVPFVTIPVYDRAGVVQSVRFRSVPGPCPHCAGAGCDRRSCDKGQIKKAYLNCTGRPLLLFNAQRLPDDRAHPVILVEGELDVIALYEYGVATEAVVSGTGGAGTFLDEWLDLLEPYRAFIICYDADGPGREGAALVASKLGKYRCLTATLPKKDAGDCLVAGVPWAQVERAINEAQPCLGVVLEQAQAWAVELEEAIANPGRLRGLPTGTAGLDAAIAGWRPGLWVATGDTSCGKTALNIWLCHQQAQLDVPVGIMSFEDQPIGVVQRLIRMDLHRDPILCTPPERADAFLRIGRRPIWILRHRGEMTGEDVVEAVRYGVRRNGIRYWLIDHLGYLYDSTDDGARGKIDWLVRNLHRAGLQDDCTIMLIAHPNRSRTTRGRDRVRISDLKESSAIEQDAVGGLVVARNKPTEDGHFKSTIYVDKLRGNYGAVGGKVELYYDREACLYADRWDTLPVARRRAAAAPIKTPEQERREDGVDSQGIQLPF